MTLRNYDPKKVLVIVAGVPITGYADGTFVDLEEMSDGVVSQSGADGEVARSLSNDPRCTITITLQQTSASNAILSGLYTADRATGAGVFPVLVEDLLGTTTFLSGQAWIKKRAKAGFGKEVGTREWMIEAIATTPSVFIVGSGLDLS